MKKSQAELHQPIRVIVFGGGPVLEWGPKQFLCRLEAHPEIELLACFCQSEGQSLLAIIGDLWRRRGLLALPLLLLQIGHRVRRFLSRPHEQMRIEREIKRLSQRIVFVPDIHAEEVLERVRSLVTDLGLIYGSPILKPKLFEIPRFGTLGIHHGRVPEYRGKKTTFWAMYNDEPTAGLTIQKVNARLDAGQIVQEGAVPIGHRSLQAVWRDLEALGLDLYIQAILEIKEGSASYRPQRGKTGKLYRDPSVQDMLRFWSRRLGKRFGQAGKRGAA